MTSIQNSVNVLRASNSRSIIDSNLTTHGPTGDSTTFKRQSIKFDKRGKAKKTRTAVQAELEADFAEYLGSSNVGSL